MVNCCYITEVVLLTVVELAQSADKTQKVTCMQYVYQPAMASPAMRHWARALDFQQVFQLTSEPHKVYNGQLYLVLYTALKTCEIGNERCSSTKIVLGYDAPLGGWERGMPVPFFAQSTSSASQSRRLVLCPSHQILATPLPASSELQ